MKFEVEDCTVRWELRTPTNDDQFQSPKFRFGDADCYLTCLKASEPDEIILWLSSREAKESSVVYHVLVEVQTTSGRYLPSLTATALHVDIFGLTIWRKEFSELEPHFLDLGYSHSWDDLDDEITDESLKLTFIVTFQASMRYPPLSDERSVQTSLTMNPIPTYEGLSDDLGKLLDSDSNHDVEFQCGGRSTKAHRLIVSARSPVLAKMLQSQTVEGAKRIVKIEDMDPSTLRLFVRYLYTGRVGEALTFEAAMALYGAANKYQVRSLARRCAQSLIENLTAENACDVLDVADRHGLHIG